MITDIFATKLRKAEANLNVQYMWVDVLEVDPSLITSSDFVRRPADKCPNQHNNSRVLQWRHNERDGDSNHRRFAV